MVAVWVLTVLACLLVLFALTVPSEMGRLTPSAFLRIPVEAVLFAALVLVLPARARRPVAFSAGALLGLLTVLKIVDIGFSAVLARPFDLVLDWSLFPITVEYLSTTIGHTGATTAAVVAVVLAVAVPILMTLSVLRLTRLVVRHDTVAIRAVSVLAVVSVSFAVLGVRIVPDVPVTVYAFNRGVQVHDGMQDQEVFAAEAAVDAFAAAPSDELLTALRGKDVIFTFIESYGRDAVTDPEFTARIGPLLQDGNRRLSAAGYTSRSGFLTSPTIGGNSWLAHATLLSGVWINNGQRYANLVTSDRLTLNGAFKRAQWRTVGVMPGNTRAWPEGAFYEYDQIYDSRHLGYDGPKFGFALVPDQFTLSAFERLERATPGRGPVMAELALVSSHSPWTPNPPLVDWDDLGDGSGFETPPKTTKGEHDDDPGRRRNRGNYVGAIEYSLSSVLSYVERYGDEDLVLILLGDHQPAPTVTGEYASHDVPITIIAGDQAVVDRISDWGWQHGLHPGPQAPVWPMNEFRDRFLTAFGPEGS